MKFRTSDETLWIIALEPSEGLGGETELFSVRAVDYRTAKEILLDWLAQDGRPNGKGQVHNRGRFSQKLGMRHFQKAWTEQGQKSVLPLARFVSSKGTG